MQRPENARERSPNTREYLHSSRGVRQLVEKLLASYRSDTQRGFVTTAYLSDREILLAHEIEPHVLVRVAAVQFDGQRPNEPAVELLCYVDRHGDYFPIVLRGHQVGRATQTPKQHALSSFADTWSDYLLRRGLMARETAPPPGAVADYLAEDVRLTEIESERLAQWVDAEHICEAIDGCFVEPRGACPHGHPSWFVELELI